MQRYGTTTTPARQGNAIVIAFGVITIAGAIAMAGADNLVNRQQAASRASHHAVAVSAVEAVLTRRQVRVAELATEGDPAAFATWTDNYGVDIVGNCEVRWRIEPVRTPTVSGSGATIPFISNPSPDLSWSPPSDAIDAKSRPLNWQPNDYIYLYRIAAESRVINEAEERPLARAQGVRYVSVNNQPLFRWVIFYAAKGPKGDLELSHGSNLNILGNVHSNGAIYLGSAPNTNMWGALKPTLGFTDIGPYDGAWANWANGTAYEIGTRVQLGSTKYRCTAAHTADASTQPGVGAGWTACWQLQWRNWANATIYDISDRVEHNGLKYKSTAPHTATADTEPGIGSAWLSTWEAVNEARVTGVNGVFRLSKQTMIGSVNDLPLFGTPPGGLTYSFGTGEAYLSSVVTSGNTVVGEPRNSSDQGAHYLLPDSAASSILGFTYDGVVVNPNRIRDDSGMQTQTASGADNRIAVNGVPLRGVVDPTDATLPANDSRDVDRDATAKWAATSRSAAPLGFDQMVRNVQTGGKVTTLPRSLENRPLEAQRLSYPTATWDSGTAYKAVMTATSDIPVVSHRGLWWVCTNNHTASAATEPGVGGSAATVWRQLPGEPHDYARPQFLKADGTSSDQPVAIGTYANGVEVPGQYQRYALGSAGLYMARRSGAKPMTGWDVVDRTGAPGGQPALVGLTIRERPVPDVELNPNHTTRIASISSSEALPYAYGKHARPSLWPFTAADVSSMGFDMFSQGIPSFYDSALTTNVGKAWTHIAEGVSGQSYALGGTIDLRAATNPGPNFPLGIYDGNNFVQRVPHYYAEDWRFIQAAQAKPDTAGSGLRATYFNDIGWDTLNATTLWHGPFGGAPVSKRVDASINFTTWADNPGIAPGLGRDYFSVRWEGFVVPTTTANYEFIADACTHGVRIWVDGKRILDRWTTSGTARRHTGTPVAMTAGQSYPIVVEFYNQTGTASIQLKWRSTDGVVAEAVVPSTALRPTLDDSATRQLNALDWSTFSAAQFRINRLSGNALQKLGLMLRAGSGQPLLHNGDDAHVAICYSPTRGIFLQQRGEKRGLERATGPTKFVGSAGTPATTSASGEVSSEDRNSNGTLDTAATPSEDANSNGALDDAATVQRRAKLLPHGPVDVLGTISYQGAASGAAASEALGWQQQTWYLPSTAGAATFGTNTSSGSSDSRLIPLTIINNPPFAVPEGTVDRIYKGPLTLSTRKQPQRRTVQSASRTWRWMIDTTTLDFPATQLFRTTSNTINDSNRSMRWFIRPAAGLPDALQTAYNAAGAAWTQTTGSGWTFHTGSPGSGINPSSPSSLLTNTLSNTSTNNSDSGWQNWGAVGPTTSTPVLTDKQVLYVTTPIDTRPKVFQGSTFIRNLTAAETVAMMDATYGSGHSAVLAIPGYPAATNATGNPGFPAIPTPTTPQSYPEAGQLRVAMAVADTTMTVKWNTDLRVNDDVMIDTERIRITSIENASLRTLTAALTNVATSTTVSSAAGLAVNDYVMIDAEQVRITAIAGLTLTISRAQNGTQAAGHAIGAQVVRSQSIGIARAQGGTVAAIHAADASIYRVRVGTLAVAVTSTTPNPWTMNLTGTVLPGDILRLDDEIVRVTAVAGSLVTLTRGNTHTSSNVGHLANTPVYRITPRTFRLDRQRTYSFDINSFASAWGNINPALPGVGATNIGWFFARKLQYLPWNTQVWAAITAPFSGGLRPDMWYQTAASPVPPTVAGAAVNSVITTALPNSGRPSVTAGSVNASVTNTQTGATLGTLRWADDKPASLPLVPPVGNSAVWLRLEKTGANNLRFRYRVGDSGGFTSLSRNDGSEAQLEVGRWFNRTVTSLTTAISSTGTTTFVVTSTAGFAINDIATVVNPLGTASEVVRVTAVPNATQLTVSRGLNSNAQASLPVGSVVTRITGPYRGGDVQLGMAIQGGPRYWTTLTSWPNNSSTSITVTSTAGIAVGDTIQIDNEQLVVTGIGVPSTTTLFVSRGQNGTTAASHSSGACVSSVTNNAANATSANISSFSIETTNPSPRNIIDSADWEEAGGGSEEMTRYLASQYQVLWGAYDITEDFFSWNEDVAGGRNATEEWIYQPREFWSQSRWWDDGSEKDLDPTAAGGNGNGSNHDETTVREWLGKTTILTLDMENVQDYIRTRTLGEATTPTLGVGTAPTLTGAAAGSVLKDSFNGLFYLTRTNRYPTNPLPGLTNPWNPLLPNTASEMARLETWNFGAFPNVLQPYGTALAQAPSFRNAIFHHGVRVVNGADIDWGLVGGDEFGASKTSIVTPNQLYVQGDLNTVPHTVTYQGGTPLKLTPTAVMGDVVTLLSNGWSDSMYKQPGIVTSPTLSYTVSGGGTLAFNQGASGLTLPQAQTTSYFASILTHNQPTTRDSVYLGESSAFINTMQYLEDWAGVNMNFLGSLVVFDSRRYSEAYLLESSKIYGRSPFGYFANGGVNTAEWMGKYATRGWVPGGTMTSQWAGQIGSVQGPPTRNMDFNYDLLTEAGTPPFTPFGVTASGVGAWTRVVE